MNRKRQIRIKSNLSFFEQILIFMTINKLLTLKCINNIIHNIEGRRCILELFEDMILNDSEPVYQQIIKYVKIKIHLGTIQNGDELASRRVLAGTLGINPNTVQKAYKLLEEEGILSTGNNVKSAIIVNEKTKNNITDELTKVAAKEFVDYAKKINLSYKDTVGLITKLWDE